MLCFFFSSRRRHTRFDCDWSSDVCSSDLPAENLRGAAGSRQAWPDHGDRLRRGSNHSRRSTRRQLCWNGGPAAFRVRSEEHTSELQSQSNLVCRLLLEKKKEQGGRDRGSG